MHNNVLLAVKKNVHDFRFLNGLSSKDSGLLFTPKEVKYINPI